MDDLSPDVSSVSIGWHIDHSLKVILAITDSLKCSAPGPIPPQLNAKRSYMFLTGRIPRGKVQSPKEVRPPEDIHKEEILAQIRLAKEKLAEWDQIGSKHIFEHHVIGKLHTRKALRFLEIHTQHHLRIIEDIRASIMSEG